MDDTPERISTDFTSLENDYPRTTILEPLYHKIIDPVEVTQDQIPATFRPVALNESMLTDYGSDDTPPQIPQTAPAKRASLVSRNDKLLVDLAAFDSGGESTAELIEVENASSLDHRTSLAVHIDQLSLDLSNLDSSAVGMVKIDSDDDASIRPARSSTSFTVMASSGMTSNTFSVEDNIREGDTRGIASPIKEIKRAMEENPELGFDEARLRLVRKQMLAAGVDPDTGLPAASVSLDKNSASIVAQTIAASSAGLSEREKLVWNHHRSAGAVEGSSREGTSTDTAAAAEHADTWLQYDLETTVEGVDVKGLIAASLVAQKAKIKRFSLRGALNGLVGTNQSSPEIPRAVYLKVCRSPEVFDSPEACSDFLRTTHPGDPKFNVVHQTEPQELKETRRFVVLPMIAVPPPPLSCGVRFELWGDVNNDGKYALIGDAMCGSSDLSLIPQNMLMLSSVFPDAADAILRVSARAVRTFSRPPELLHGTRWMGQAFSLPHQLRQPAILKEQLGESPLAFEVPEKLLVLRREDLLNELAMLEGKMGEIEHLHSATASHISVLSAAEAMNGEPGSSLSGRSYGVLIDALAELSENCNRQIRNYSTMIRYYGECARSGRGNSNDSTFKDTPPEFTPILFKQSTRRKEAALQAVATNLHIYRVGIEPPETRSAEFSGAAVAGDDDVTIITCGVPAAHALGFGGGGLAAMQAKLTEAYQFIPNDGRSQLHRSAASAIQTLRLDGDEPAFSKASQAAAAARLAFAVRVRTDIVLGQMLGIVSTSFLTVLNKLLANHDDRLLKRLAEYGFLVSIESLLSTGGTEQKMMGDMQASVKLVRELIVFELRKRVSPDEDGEVVSIVKRQLTSGEGFAVQVLLNSDAWSVLPQALQQGNAIPVHPVLFTQGVNEWQVMSNLLGTNGFQTNANMLAVRQLQGFMEQCMCNCEFAHEQDQYSIALLQDLQQLTAPKGARRNTKGFEHELLWLAADCVRALGGGRVSCCKSGKDRTAQAVTLEATRTLAKASGLRRSSEQALANLMREFGVRRANVWKNTGTFAYAFNALQVKSLPLPYRPPQGTYRHGLAS